LLKLRDVVQLAQADEDIARAKAGMPVSETAATVEKNYYELLIAERKLAIAKADAENVRGQQLLARKATLPGSLPDRNAVELETGKALLLAESEVKELSASLDGLLGYPIETDLELVLRRWNSKRSLSKRLPTKR
jgi:hypothetical protein